MKLKNTDDYQNNEEGSQPFGNVGGVGLLAASAGCLGSVGGVNVGGVGHLATPEGSAFWWRRRGRLSAHRTVGLLAIPLHVVSLGRSWDRESIQKFDGQFWSHPRRGTNQDGRHRSRSQTGDNSLPIAANVDRRIVVSPLLDVVATSGQRIVLLFDGRDRNTVRPSSKSLAHLDNDRGGQPGGRSESGSTTLRVVSKVD